MIVLLKELKIQSITDLASQYCLQLLKSLSLHGIPILDLQSFHDLWREFLVLIIQHIKRNLICNQVVALLLIAGGLNESAEEFGAGLGDVQEELALHDLIVVEVAPVFGFIDQEKEGQDVISEAFVATHNVLSDGEGVAQFVLDVTGFLNGFTHFFESTGFECNTDSLVELMVLIATLEHFVNDTLHFSVNNYAFLFFVDNSDSLFDVFIDTLMDKSLHILRALV